MSPGVLALAAAIGLIIVSAIGGGIKSPWGEVPPLETSRRWLCLLASLPLFALGAWLTIRDGRPTPVETLREPTQAATASPIASGGASEATKTDLAPEKRTPCRVIQSTQGERHDEGNASTLHT